MEKFEEILASAREIARRRKTAGWGINDAPYMTQLTAGGDDRKCPYYMAWNRIIQAVHGENGEGSICSDWRSFMSFRQWMEAQDWTGKKRLDATLLSGTPKVYSPETCVFISYEVASAALILKREPRGDMPLGVDEPSKGKYRATCNGSHLGYFSSKEDAHRAWRAHKAGAIFGLAHLQDDPRVGIALLQISRELTTSV